MMVFLAAKSQKSVLTIVVDINRCEIDSII